MVERRVINRVVLINKLNSMRYENIDLQQLECIMLNLGHTIQIKEEGDEDCNTN